MVHGHCITAKTLQGSMKRNIYNENEIFVCFRIIRWCLKKDLFLGNDRRISKISTISECS